MSITKLFVSVGVLIILSSVAYSFFSTKNDPSVSNVVCTMEAKLCPDGSYVSRTGPKCEFKECPNVVGIPTPPTLSNKDVGVLTGQVLLSPVCPVERIPPDPACAPKPYPVIVDVFKGNGLVLQVHADAQGKIFIHLLVGSYTISPHVENFYPRCQSQNVKIEKNSTTTINIFCDTGIR